MVVWLVCWLYVNLFFQQGTAQYYWPAYSGATQNQQNASVYPYPYQNVLGLGMPDPQNMGIPSVYPAPYPYMEPYGSLVNMNAYYAMLAQQGRPVYQGYLSQYSGYPNQFGLVGQPGNADPTQKTKGTGDQQSSNIKTEILDVSPEYQRQLLGWPTDPKEPGQNDACTGSNCLRSKPRYIVDIDQQTSNVTNIPVNLTKPIITEKRFITSIRRTFVYDSSKPENVKPINIHIINGQQVTTTAPPETTANEDVQGITSWYETLV